MPIQKTTKINIADNSGAILAKCTHCYLGTTSTVGQRIRAAVRTATPNTKIKKGDKVTAIIVRQSSQIYLNESGMRVRYSDNAGVLINDKNEIIGTRVFGPVSAKLRKNPSLLKILSLASEII